MAGWAADGAEVDVPGAWQLFVPGGLSRPGGAGGAGAGFAAGQAGDELAPGVVLAGLAARAWDQCERVSDDELIGVARAWRRLSAWAAAGEAAAVAELAARREAQVTAGADPHLAEHVADEVAAALTLTGRAAGDLMDFAVGLQRLPATGEALRTGLIDRAKAAVIAGETACLDDSHAAAVEAAVIGRAAGQTTGALRAAVRRAVLATDPAAAGRRRTEALTRARVEAWDEQSGTAALAGRDLPPADVLAADRRIDELARQLKHAGAGDSLENLRARVFTALLLGIPLASLRPAAQDPARQDPAHRAPAHQDPTAPDYTTQGYTAPGCTTQGCTTQGCTTQGCAPHGRAPHGRTGSGGQRGGLDPDGLARTARVSEPAGVAWLDGAAGGPLGGSLLGTAAALDGAAGGPLGGSLLGTAAGLSGPPLAGTVNLTLPLATWLGGNEPGEADGYWPLPGDDARILAHLLAGHPGTRTCLTITSRDGTALAHGCTRLRRPHPGGQPELTFTITPLAASTCGHAGQSASYRPPPRLRHLVEIRYRRCSYPGCRRNARRCDLDHTVPHDQGGATCECNLAPLCRKHHQAKQTQGWHLEQPQPGTVIWTLPHGRRYQAGPGTYPSGGP